MDGTRRFWSGLAGVGLLAVGAVVVARPLVLVGAGALGAFLLATQYQFVRTVTRLDETVTVEQSVTPDTVSTTDTARLVCEVTLDAPRRETLTVRLRPPAGVRVADPEALSVTLEPGDRTASTVVSVEAPVAGSHTFDPPAATVVDDRIRFRETLSVGAPVTLRARPPALGDLHVGRGGDPIAVGYGEHGATRGGAGLEPAELREYQPGDAANRIAWKATARLDETFVREFEAETDRTVALVVDGRESMAAGAPGRTKADVARALGLAALDSARRAADPLALVLCDEAGVRDALDPAATHDHYERARGRLDQVRAPETGDTSGQSELRGQGHRSTDLARQRAALLADDETRFGRTLRPYVGAVGTHVERVADDPLFAAVRARVARVGGTVRTVLITDDTHRAEVFETAKLARTRTERVTVFLLPSVLYEPGALADPAAAYDRYRSFEEFRRRLDRLAGVSAFEAGPRDRLDAVLDSRPEGRPA